VSGVLKFRGLKKGYQINKNLQVSFRHLEVCPIMLSHVHH
jgi:hypothetical protein